MFGTGLFAPAYRRLITTKEQISTATEAVQTTIRSALEAAKTDLDMRQRIAIVGNATVHPGHGKLIDQHGLVIRFNACWQYGQAGRRTDVLVLNNTGGGGKHLAYAADAINLDALAAARRFWLVAAPAIIRARGDEDYTDAMVERRIGTRPWRYLAAGTYLAAKKALTEQGAEDGFRPSSGLIVLFHIIRSLHRWRPITLFGFSHEGWEGHAWNAERAVIDNWRGWRKLTRVG